MNVAGTPSSDPPRMTSLVSMPRRAALAFVIDLIVIVVFVAVGRRNHDEDLSIAGYTGAVAPFVLALAATWMAGRLWRDPWSLRSGVIVWIGTISLGMVVRRFVFDDGTATAFIIVAAVFVGAFANGWRTFVRFRASS